MAAPTGNWNYTDSQGMSHSVDLAKNKVSIDGGEPVYGEFKVPDALDLADVIAAGGDSRFKVVVDVSGLKDGQIHKIEVVARLQNGEIVLLNRNDKDRAVFVNYQAMLEESNPTTGDAAVALFAAAAVVMLGALVAFKRKRAF